MKCCICGKRPPSDCCHIKTRGSGGPDVEDNVFPACRKHHQMQGAIGFIRMFAKFPDFCNVIFNKGWAIGNERGYYYLVRTRDFNG